MATDKRKSFLFKAQGLSENYQRNITGMGIRVTVDYSKSLAEMIVAGNYDWQHPDIAAEHFLLIGKGKMEVEIFFSHFGKEMTSNGVITEIDGQDFRPAKIEELLALGASQPELQKQFPIIALGSVWQSPSGNRYVPYLLWLDGERRLNLFRLGRVWDEYLRFACVHKVGN